MKAASPKKETARIQVPPQAKTMPQATLKMQQPKQPLAAAPVPRIQSAPTLAPAGAGLQGEEEDEEDPMVAPLSWIALIASLIALVMTYLAFAA